MHHRMERLRRQPRKCGFVGASNRGRDCRRRLQRVTSATCADGCATAQSGANSNRKNRGRTSRCPYSHDFPNPSPTISVTAKKSLGTSLPLVRMAIRLRTVSRRRRRAVVEKSHPKAFAATGAGGGEGVDGVEGRKRRSRHQPSPPPGDRPEKRPKQIPPLRLPKPAQHRHRVRRHLTR